MPPITFTFKDQVESLDLPPTIPRADLVSTLQALFKIPQQIRLVLNGMKLTESSVALKEGDLVEVVPVGVRRATGSYVAESYYEGRFVIAFIREGE